MLGERLVPVAVGAVPQRRRRLVPPLETRVDQVLERQVTLALGRGGGNIAVRTCLRVHVRACMCAWDHEEARGRQLIAQSLTDAWDPRNGSV